MDLQVVKKNVVLINTLYVEFEFIGGIASGKSSVAKRLKEHGAFIIDCDKVAHEIYKPGKPCYFQLIDTFSKSIIADNGEINRKILAEIVFTDTVSNILILI